MSKKNVYQSLMIDNCVKKYLKQLRCVVDCLKSYLRTSKEQYAV